MLHIPSIVMVVIDGFVYRLARDEQIWRAAGMKRWFGIERPDGEFHNHHIAGRYGILKLLIENHIPIGPTIHGYEKSSNVQDREACKGFIHSVVERRYPGLYDRLMRIQKHEEWFPKTLKIKIVEKEEEDAKS